MCRFSSSREMEADGKPTAIGRWNGVVSAAVNADVETEVCVGGGEYAATLFRAMDAWNGVGVAANAKTEVGTEVCGGGGERAETICNFEL